MDAPVGFPSSTSTALEPESLERIQKLEELVENLEARQRASAKHQPQDLETSAGQAVSLPGKERLDDDVAWLESIYSDHDLSVIIIVFQHYSQSDDWSQDKIPSKTIVFRTCPIQQIMGTQPYVSQSSFHTSTWVEPSRIVWLPQYTEARILLEKFIQDIDHIHHVVHCSSLLSVLDEVYACLNQQSQVKSGTIILLLSIFASSSHSWVRQDYERGLFSTAADANSQSPLWIKATEDVLDVGHRSACVSIEGIQGIIIVSLVLGNLEGISRRCRSFYNMALLLARELGLHRLDHPSHSPLANSAAAEIGRRVWWYLVASDWLASARSTLSVLTDGLLGLWQQGLVAHREAFIHAIYVKWRYKSP